MHSTELRDKFLKFFKEKGHTIIDGASVIPENDPSVLFTTAGMHPLIPYLMGQKHPAGTRLCDVQKCIRTGDIDEVGDSSHLTFFEMLGNWSLGDYFKEDAIKWSWEFLTKPEWLGIDPENLAFTVFAGDDDCPRDIESYNLWRSCGVPEDRIFFLPKENNWWHAGATGPCGPDTEMFIIDQSKPPCSPECSPACSCGRYLEIWNDVFMQFNKTPEGKYEPLSKKNVDTGMGFERTLCILNGYSNVYETDLFKDILAKIEELSGKSYGESEETTKAFRIIADHMRTSTIILGDRRGVTPSNVDQGYVLRRLIRRAIRYAMMLGIEGKDLTEVASVIINQYAGVYPEIKENEAFIIEQFSLEEERFSRTLRQGIKEFEKLYNRIKGTLDIFQELKERLQEGFLKPENIEALKQIEETAKKAGGSIRPEPEMLELIEDTKTFINAVQTINNFADKTLAAMENIKKINGRSAFKLYDTYGFPIEITIEMAREKGLIVDEDDFMERFKQHQQKSHSGAEQRFKGGLAESSEATANLHTATHLLHSALRKVLGEGVQQKGSNITAERLRFDFSFPRKMTKEELDEVEKLVNEAIEADVPIICEELPLEDAKKTGAIGLFESKYDTVVKVYTMGRFSKEICGGPHADHTGKLGKFRIKKEESSSAGVRRIKAVLE